MINIKYKMDGKEIVDAWDNLLKDGRKAHFGMSIFGLVFGTLILGLGILKILEPWLFLLIMGIVLLLLSIALMITVYLRLPKTMYKRVEKKQNYLLNGAEYDLIIDNGQVTLHEKNAKAETTTVFKTDEYKNVILKNKYYYFLFNKKIGSIHLIVPKNVFSLEQKDELFTIFSGKFKYLDK